MCFVFFPLSFPYSLVLLCILHCAFYATVATTVEFCIRLRALEERERETVGKNAYFARAHGNIRTSYAKQNSAVAAGGENKPRMVVQRVSADVSE